VKEKKSRRNKLERVRKKERKKERKREKEREREEREGPLYK